MQIGIVSDSHSNRTKVSRAVGLLETLGITTVLHCGDIADAAVVEAFANFKSYFVFGNVDFDRQSLLAAMRRTGAVCCGEFGELELAGRKIAFLHGDDKRRLEREAHSGHYDLVGYGHTHKAESHRTGSTLVVNPGALHRAKTHTLAVYDAQQGGVEIIPLQARL